MHTLPEISTGLQEVIDQVHTYVEALSPEAFLHSPAPGKWSAGQNLEHLVLSTKPLAKTMLLPKLTFRTFGKPNRPGRSYEALVQRYLERLPQAPPTPPRSFQPADHTEEDQGRLLQAWKKEGDKLVGSLIKWKEKDLDAYLLPHPLLGKLTIREMLFFTHYHSLHHLALIEERANSLT